MIVDTKGFTHAYFLGEISSNKKEIRKYLEFNLRWLELKIDPFQIFFNVGFVYKEVTEFELWESTILVPAYQSFDIKPQFQLILSKKEKPSELILSYTGDQVKIGFITHWFWD
jgi:hypothetical protein